MGKFYVLRTRSRHGKDKRDCFSYAGDVGVVALNKAHAQWGLLVRQGYTFISLEHRIAEDDDETSEGRLIKEYPEPVIEDTTPSQDVSFADDEGEMPVTSSPQQQSHPASAPRLSSTTTAPAGVRDLVSLLGSVSVEDIRKRLNELDVERGILTAVLHTMTSQSSE